MCCVKNINVLLWIVLQVLFAGKVLWTVRTYKAQNILNTNMPARCLYCQVMLFRTWKLLRKHSVGRHLCCGFFVPQLGQAPQGISQGYTQVNQNYKFFNVARLIFCNLKTDTHSCLIVSISGKKSLRNVSKLTFKSFSVYIHTEKVIGLVYMNPHVWRDTRLPF